MTPTCSVVTKVNDHVIFVQMIITKDESPTPFRIRRYEAGAVTVNEKTYRHNIVIYQETLVGNWGPQQASLLKTADFDALADCGTKLIIVGTGAKQTFPKVDLYAHLLERGIIFEFMNTKTACHTFNILMSENRDAACALLLSH